MPNDSVTFEELMAQIERLHRDMMRNMDLAARHYRNERLRNTHYQLQQIAFKQVEQLIERNIVPVLQGLNPAQVAGAMAACGASAQLKTEVTAALSAARTAAAAAEAVAAEQRALFIARMIGVSLVGLLIIAAIAVLYLWWNSVHKEKQREEYERAGALQREYERNLRTSYFQQNQRYNMPKNL
jgi:hypothetical protein